MNKHDEHTNTSPLRFEKRVLNRRYCTLWKENPHLYFFYCSTKRVVNNILTLLAPLIGFRLLQAGFIFDKYYTIIATYLFAQNPS